MPVKLSIGMKSDFRLDQKPNQSLISFRHELVELGKNAGWNDEITKENLAKVLKANAKLYLHIANYVKIHDLDYTPNHPITSKEQFLYKKNTSSTF
ncbi:hypothetical protein A3Q56_07957 [Intoshia linei]|uniref:Uncharacterized protein n=1 Tax=Intoshia linei TaxID=1819745 RepID=A0A177AQQ6_9BILA|nr:hypothetical protein A3Q56_07957 [Intoshia linei]